VVSCSDEDAVWDADTGGFKNVLESSRDRPLEGLLSRSDIPIEMLPNKVRTLTFKQYTIIKLLALAVYRCRSL